MISKQVLLSLSILLCLHVTGEAVEIPCMPLWGAAKTVPWAVHSCKAVLAWCERQYSKGKMQFIVFSDGWWMWYTVTFKPLLPTHSPFFYPCHLQPLCCHILGCCMLCKAGEIISLWIWMKLDTQNWVCCSDLRQQKGYCCYQKVKVEMGTQVSLTILSEKQIEIY